MFFDCHFHPVFKQYITRFEDGYPSAREARELVREMDLKHDLMDIADEVVLHILESQCCLEQMKKGGVRLGIANIASIEHGIADSEGFLSKILKSGWTKPMDQRFMRSVQRGALSYYRLFLKELDLYRTLGRISPEGAHLQFLTRKKEPEWNDRQLFLALGLEGGHNLSRFKIARPGSYDTVTEEGHHDAVYEDFCREPKAGAVESLQRLQQALWEEDMDLFYLTLTHLTHIVEQPLATHAYGLKMLKHGAFYPVGNGITPLGREVVRAAYGMKVDGGKTATPILIDIKHMSLSSRQDLYALRREQPEFERIPIIASHMGVTGYSMDEWVDAISGCNAHTDNGIRVAEIMTERKKAGEWGSGLNNDFTFNPWSINLMDEDIIEVMRSRGLIGLSLDVRILGFQAKIGASSKEQTEYLSLADFKTWFPHLSLGPEVAGPLESAEAAESWLIPTKEERHPLCLCFNILHTVSVVQANRSQLPADLDPWQHLCIGSDFDGLIDPVKICRDASKMPALEKALLKWLPVAEKAYRSENGGPELLPRTRSKEIDFAKLARAVRGLMFENGKRMLQEWLKNQWVKPEAIEATRSTTTVRPVGTFE